MRRPPLSTIVAGGLAGWLLLLSVRGSDAVAASPHACDSVWWVAWGGALGALLLLLFGGLDGRFSQREFPFLRPFLGVGASTLLFSVWLMVGLTVDLGYRGLSPWWFGGYASLLLKLGVIGILLLIATNLGHYVLYAYYRSSQRRLALAERRASELELRWRVLRAQLRPHFLFNSFNTAAALIDEDAGRADAYLEKLATTYDFLLSHHDRPLVTVAEEMKLVGAYAYLLEIRYGDRLSIVDRVTPEVDNRRLPPLAVQLLVENAVKHNRAESGAPLTVEITAEGDTIRVSNRLQPRVTAPASLGVGLDNLRARYELLGKRRIGISQDETFTVTLPLL